MTAGVGRGSFRWRGALRHRNFRLFWFGQLISLVGTWMQSIGLAWLVLLLTHDPLWLGFVAAAQFLPVLILGLFGGIIADVLPKRRTLVGTQTASMLLAFVLAALTFANVAQVWEILLLAALLGLVNAVDMPTRQSFVIEMVGVEDVTNAVGLNSAVFNAARIVGPALGGILIGLVGVTACFFLNGVSFIAVIVGLLLMRESDLRAAARLARPTSVRAVADDLAEGLRYVRATPVVLLAVCLVGFVSTFAMNFNVIAPALAQDVLGVGATGLGFLLSSMGLGSLVAALLVASLRRPRPWIMVVGALVLGVLEVALGGIRSYPFALVAMFGAGAGAIAMMVSANTAIQLAVPDRLRGRVMSVYTTVFSGSTPIGAPVIGWLASAFSTEVALIVGGATAIVAALVAGAWVLRGGLSLLPGSLAERLGPEAVAAAGPPPGAGT
ncbi:MAG: MFS transporter [Candidatus Limnocylindrales bacterium]|nr:MFS transporter [Candidatus Limnocylindrales bacterium]